MGEDEETNKDLEIPTVIVNKHASCVMQSSWLLSERPFGIITNASIHLVTTKKELKRIPIKPSRFTVVPNGKTRKYNINSDRCHLVVSDSFVMLSRTTTLVSLRVKNGTVKYTYFVARIGNRCVIHINEGTIDLTGSIFHELVIHGKGGSVFGFRVVSKLTVFLDAPTQISGKTHKTTLVFKHGDGDIDLQEFTRRL